MDPYPFIRGWEPEAGVPHLPHFEGNSDADQSVVVIRDPGMQTVAYPMIILVRNLDRSTTEKDLQALFFRYGRVSSCDLVTEADSGKSKGFGFVNMPNINEGLAAIKELNGTKLGKNLIRVKKAATSTVMKRVGKRPQP